MARTKNAAARYFYVPYSTNDEVGYVSLHAIIVRASSAKQVKNAIVDETREGDFPPELAAKLETDEYSGDTVESDGWAFHYITGMSQEPWDEDDEGEPETLVFAVTFSEPQSFATLKDAENAADEDRIVGPEVYRADARGGLQKVTKGSRSANTKKRARNAKPGTREWYRRNLIVDQDVVERTSHWHGGQGSEIYSFTSTAANDYVSPSMVQRAIDDLEYAKGKTKSRKTKTELNNLIGDLQGYTIYSDEHTTKEAGVGDKDSGYDERGMAMDEVSFNDENPRRGRRARGRRQKNTHDPNRSARNAAQSLRTAESYLTDATEKLEDGDLQGGAASLLNAVLLLGSARTEIIYADGLADGDTTDRVQELVGYVSKGTWAKTVEAAAYQVPLAAENPRRGRKKRSKKRATRKRATKKRTAKRRPKKRATKRRTRRR